MKANTKSSRRFRAPILNYFPAGLTPRPIQRQILKSLEADWNKYDVFVIQVPTAGGKTALAQTLAAWTDFSSIIVPNNLLLDQYREAAPTFSTLYRREAYWCGPHQRDCDSSHKKKLCEDCPEEVKMTCPYLKATEKAYKATTVVSNYWSYLAHSLYKDTLIVDEAHLLLETLKGLATKRIWKREYNWPTTIKTLDDIYSWLDDILEEDGGKDDKKLIKLHKELVSSKPSMLIQKTVESLRGTPEPVLKMIPLDVRNEPPTFWPFSKVKKIVLMSATINKPDIECMGLGARRVKYYEVDSPIPAERRRIIYDPVANMGYKNQERAIPELAFWLEDILDAHPNEKGLIHAPYSMIPLLREALSGVDRLVWHGREDKDAVYQAWRESPAEQGAVLVASGLYEGVDIAYDAGWWQVIAKIPFPSLADPGIRAKLEEDQDWYNWQTVKTVLQASGRICRTPEDMGITYIPDTNFELLLKKAAHLFPRWWKEALEDESIPN